MGDVEKKIGRDETPWLVKWTDEDDRKFYELQARERYELYKEMRKESFRAHVEYGNWLIATMVAIHGGALFALNAIRNSSPSMSEQSVAGLVSAASWHVGGIVFIMIAGFMAWLNFQCAAAIYDRWAEPAMLQSLDHWPKDDDQTDPISATLFLAGAAGILSAFCLVTGSMKALAAINPA